jgi:hypothetical protein
MTPLTRRAFVERSLLAASVGLIAPRFLQGQDAVPGGSLRPAQVLIDMVHNNPGETPFVTHYNDMAFVKSLGFKGKVFELFEGAQFGIDWSSIDPDIFPTGSPERAWLDRKATELDQLYTAAQQAGLGVYCHTDMIVFPKRLVEKFHPAHFDHVSDPDTQRFLRAGVRQMFQRFPQVDGLVIRIGETYLQGAPYHTGGIGNKGDAKKNHHPSHAAAARGSVRQAQQEDHLPRVAQFRHLRAHLPRGQQRGRAAPEPDDLGQALRG